MTFDGENAHDLEDGADLSPRVAGSPETRRLLAHVVVRWCDQIANGL